MDGQSKTATLLGVSLAHLRKVMDSVGIEWRTPKVNRETAVSALERFGSVILAARLLNTTPAEIKKACPEWKDLRDPLKTGRQSIATGRTGELLWATIRATETLEKTCLDNHNAPDHDFVDRQYGLVNVKTANPQKQKNKDIWTWTWGVNFNQKADVFPLVLLDRNCKGVGIILCSRDEQNNPSVPECCRVSKWTDGSYGISFKSEVDTPNFEGLFWKI